MRPRPLALGAKGTEGRGLIRGVGENTTYRDSNSARAIMIRPNRPRQRVLFVTLASAETECSNAAKPWTWSKMSAYSTIRRL